MEHTIFEYQVEFLNAQAETSEVTIVGLPNNNSSTESNDFGFVVLLKGRGKLSDCRDERRGDALRFLTTKIKWTENFGGVTRSSVVVNWAGLQSEINRKVDEYNSRHKSKNQLPAQVRPDWSEFSIEIDLISPFHTLEGDV